MKIVFSVALLLPALPRFVGGGPLQCNDGVTAYYQNARCDGDNFTFILRSCSSESIETHPCSEYSDIGTFQYCHICGVMGVCSDNNDTEAVCSDVNSDTCSTINYEVGTFDCSSPTEVFSPYWVCNNGAKEVFDGPDQKVLCVEGFLNSEAPMCHDCGADGQFCSSEGQTCESLVGSPVGTSTTSGSPSAHSLTLWLALEAMVVGCTLGHH